MKRVLTLLLIPALGCTTKLTFEFSTMKQWDRPGEVTTTRSEDTSGNVKQPPKSEILSPVPVDVTPAVTPATPPVQPRVEPAPLKPQGSIVPEVIKDEVGMYYHVPHSEDSACYVVATKTALNVGK